MEYFEGNRVIVTRMVKRCRVEIAAGEAGEIIDVDPENGNLVIQLDGINPDLEFIGNTIWLPAHQYDALELAA